VTSSKGGVAWRRHQWKVSHGYISGTVYPIDFKFGVDLPWSNLHWLTTGK
jgi:hypothetical protein